MSKAYDKALEAFPIIFSERFCYDKTNIWQERRNAFEKGYEQAIKDVYAEVERLNKRNEDARAERKNSEPLYYDGKSDGFNGLFCFLDNILDL